jgi:hypothetical protein
LLEKSFENRHNNIILLKKFKMLKELTLNKKYLLLIKNLTSSKDNKYLLKKLVSHYKFKMYKNFVKFKISAKNNNNSKIYKDKVIEKTLKIINCNIIKVLKNYYSILTLNSLERLASKSIQNVYETAE